MAPERLRTLRRVEGGPAWNELFDLFENTGEVEGSRTGIFPHVVAVSAAGNR